MKTLLFSILFFCSIIAIGQVPTNDEINSIVVSWLLKKNNNNSSGFKRGASFQVTAIKQVYVKNNLLYHVVKLLPKGFIVISNNKSIEPIISYSFNSDFPFTTDSTNTIFNLLSSDLLYREENLLSKTDKWEAELHKLKSSTISEFQQWPPEGSTSSEGWIESTWTQTEPYNNFCPLDLPRPDNPRSVVGCSATAWAQVINYYKPNKGLELDSTDKYTTKTLGINFESDSTKYDFPSFKRLNNYLTILKQKYVNNQQIDYQDIAALNLFAGIQSRMDYTSYGSGATLLELPYRAKSGFKSYRRFLGFGQSDWTDFYPILKSNLMNGLPALFTANSSSFCQVSHAVICDGYNTNGFYHINFGWGADAPDNIIEAWYNLPTMAQNYNVISEAIVNLTTDKINIYPLEVSKSNIQFGGVKLNTVSNSIRISFTNPTSRTISITPNVLQGPFDISFNNIDFTKSIQTFALAPNETKYLYVRGFPDALKEFNSSWLIEIQDIKMYYCMLDFSMTGMEEIGTIVQPGEISGTWTKENSPYLITGDVYVKHLDSLKIEPGVQIVMKGSFKFGIPGDSKFEAIGTRQDSIKFFAEDTLTGWLGIDFMRSSMYPNSPNFSSDLKIKNTLAYCIIRDGKSFESFPQWSGGGIFISIYDNVDFLIKNCKIVNNSALSGGALFIEGPWDYNFDCKIQIANTLFAHNKASQGGIIYISATSLARPNNKIEFTNVTISGNDNTGGTIHMNMKSSVSFSNCIIWGNDSWNMNIFSLGEDNHGVTEPDLLEVNYCDIDTSNQNWKSFGDVTGKIIWGEGNIVQDPKFAYSLKRSGLISNEYFLASNSPCVDAGNINPVYNDKENSDSPYLAIFPSLGSIRNDMGSYGGGVYTFNLPIPILVSPINNSEFKPGEIDNYITFIWQYEDVFAKYNLQVSTSPEFNEVVFEDSAISSNSQIITGILQNQITDYYWRVRGKTRINTYSPWSDIHMIRVNTLTGINNEIVNSNLKVYPNPVCNELNIEVEGNKEIKNFGIFNSVGKTVSKGIIKEKAIVNTANFYPGVYYIRLENGNNLEYRKFVKE